MYANGKMVGKKSLSLPNIGNEINLVIGKKPGTPLINHLFPTGVSNGLLDEFRIYDTTLTNQEIDSLANKNYSKPNFVITLSQLVADPQRSEYHALPLDHWTNEPHGLIRDKRGNYHLFFQNNPNGPYWSQIHWEDKKTGHQIAIGIIPDNRDAKDQYKAGWANVHSLPREIYLDNSDHLIIKPYRGLEKLRGHPISLKNILLKPNDKKNPLKDIKGNQLEVQLSLFPHKAHKISLIVRKSKDGSEQTRIIFDQVANTLTLDRSKSSIGTSGSKDVKTVPFNINESKKLFLDVFIDHSVLKFFINHQYAFTTRIYPTKKSLGIDLSVSGKSAKLMSAHAWKMNSIWK